MGVSALGRLDALGRFGLPRLSDRPLGKGRHDSDLGRHGVRCWYEASPVFPGVHVHNVCPGRHSHKFPSLAVHMSSPKRYCCSCCRPSVDGGHACHRTCQGCRAKKWRERRACLCSLVRGLVLVLVISEIVRSHFSLSLQLGLTRGPCVRWRHRCWHMLIGELFNLFSSNIVFGVGGACIGVASFGAR